MRLDRLESVTLALTLVGRYLDLITTFIIVFSRLGYEANPFMRPYVYDPPALLLVQTLGGLALWSILYFAGKVAGARIRCVWLWLAVALSWLPVFNNLLTPFGFSPLAILYAR
jgi:hypothetical protein